MPYHKKHRDLIRGLILCRDGFRCVLCKFQSTANHMHHINNIPSDNSPNNLITLCPHCHMRFGRSKSLISLQSLIIASPVQEFIHTQIEYILREHL